MRAAVRRLRQRLGRLLHGGVRSAVAVLLVILFAVVALALVASARSVDGIRSDFCTWAIVHYETAESHARPDAALRTDTASDLKLLRQLGCGHFSPGKP